MPDVPSVCIGSCVRAAQPIIDAAPVGPDLLAWLTTLGIFLGGVGGLWLAYLKWSEMRGKKGSS